MRYPKPIARTNSATTANGTSHALSLGAGVAGDLVVAFVVFDGQPAITWPTGWTQAFLVNGNGSIRAECRWKVIEAEGADITLATDASEEMQGRVWRLDKGTFADPPQVEAATASGTSASPDAPSLAPSWGSDKNGWLVLVGTDAARAVSNPPTGYVQAGTANSGGAGGAGIGYGERQLEAASDNPAAVTITSAAWIAATVAVRGRGEAAIRAAVAAWVEDRLAPLAALQATYASNHGGRYFQGIRWTVPADGKDVDSNLALEPHDQAESWADFGANIPTRVPGSLAIDVYYTGVAWGYTVTAMVLLGGVRWIRVWSGSSDPENRARDWYADIEPET